MTVAEKIVQRVRSLPESVQAEVLDFVQRLETKSEGIPKVSEDTAWSEFSLSRAMHGLDSEPALYSRRDLKEVFP